MPEQRGADRAVRVSAAFQEAAGDAFLYGHGEEDWIPLGAVGTSGCMLPVRAKR